MDTQSPAGPVSRRAVVLFTAAVILASAGITGWQIAVHRGGGSGPPGANNVTPTPSATATVSPSSTVPPPAANATVASVDMITADAGWGRTRDGGVVHTDKGVSSWTNVSPPTDPGSIAAAAFIDSEHAVVYVIGNAYTGGQLTIGNAWRTADAGRTWTAGTPFRGTGAMDLLNFLDVQHGWLFVHLAVGADSDSVVLLRTVDGGATFTEMSRTIGAGDATPGALPYRCIKDAPRFATPLVGFDGGGCTGDDVFLYRTGDGGRTWVQVAVPAPAGLDLRNCACSVMSPVFATARDGVLTVGGTDLTGRDFGSFVATTADGGAHWTPRDAMAGVAVAGLADTDGVNLLLLDGHTPYRLLSSADSGRTWATVSTDPRLTGRIVDFVTPRLGWAWSTFSSGGDATMRSVLQTDDGGAHWIEVTPNVVVPGG